MVGQGSKMSNEENKTNDFLSGMGCIALIIVIIVVWAYIHVENKKLDYKKQEKLEQQLEENKQKDALNNCLADARQDYHYNWEDACKKNKKGSDCALPSHQANSIEKWKSEAEKQCMEKYKMKAF